MHRRAFSRTATVLVSAALASLVTTAAERDAHAEEPSAKVHSVAILGIGSDDAEEQAEALTTTLRTKVRATAGWSLGDATQSLSMLTAALKCPQVPDGACEQRISEQIKTDRYVWGTMKKGPPGKVSVELHFFEKGKPGVVATASYSENLKDQNDDSLRREAQGLLVKLQSTSVGTVNIRSSTTDGEVLIDGTRKEQLKGGAFKVDLASGPHTFDVTPSGSPVEHKTVDVVGGKTIELAAGPAPVTEDAGPVVSKRKVLGVGAGVVGVGAAVTSIAFAVAWQGLQDDNNAQLKNVPKGADVTTLCKDKSAASVACNHYNANNGTAQLFSGLAWGFGGLAVAGIGASVYLLFLSPGTEAAGKPTPQATNTTTFHVLPQVGPTGGSMSVAGSF